MGEQSSNAAAFSAGEDLSMRKAHTILASAIEMDENVLDHPPLLRRKH
jgi:hypothetical protein